MTKSLELLAPGGDIDSIKASIIAGANAVYCGLDKFNARNRATNISIDELNGILHLAHSHNCQVFLTLNIIIVDSELPALISLLNKLVNTSIDGIILQDLGLFYLISKYFKSLKIHASTQLTTHNEGQIRFLSELGATQVNLSREMNIHEIKALTAVAHEHNILSEVFVHGSNCICFSGICYMSSVQSGNSGNRGRCSQPCRDQYLETPLGKSFPLNLKDNSAYLNLKELIDAGVDSLKIEGRIKKFHYVYTIVDAWRKQLERFYHEQPLNTDNSILYKVFNRNFSNTFLKGDISKDQFIDNPRDHSAIYLSESNGSSTDEKLEKAKGDIYDERTEIITQVENEINQLSAEKVPVIISVSGECGTPLCVSVNTSDVSFDVFSECNLSDFGNEILNFEMLYKRLKSINDTEYFIEDLELSNLKPGLFIPFKELTFIKNRILFVLNGSKETAAPIDIPVLKKHERQSIKASISVLISSLEDLKVSKETSATIYYQLPNDMKNQVAELIKMFSENPEITPCFPSILIGEDYNASLEFLKKVQPKSIVTNNSGIANHAYKNNISWIAGSYLNLANSWSLKCLKEKFNCAGAFLSNEISKVQLKSIKKPDDFKLYYSIYHPLLLMTSRQCLFHQVTGCKKSHIDDTCIPHCERSATITNLKNETFVIEKSKGYYHRIYNHSNYLNTAVVADIPDLFHSFFIDLTDIKNATNIAVDKLKVIKHFENLLNGDVESEKELSLIFPQTTRGQYEKGI